MQGQLKQLGLLIGVMCGAVLLPAPSAGATSVDWTSVEPQYDGVVDAPVYKSPCESRNAAVDGIKERNGEPHEVDICYHDRGTWGYGRYYYHRDLFYKGNGNAIRFGPIGPMYRINTDLFSNGGVQLVDVPNTDDVIRLHRYEFWYYRNFPSKFQRDLSSTSVTKYDFDRDSFDFQLQRPDGTVIKSRGLALSSNGKWAVAEALGVGLVRINLETFAVKRFSEINIDYGISRWPGPQADMAVSNDGQHAVIAGWNSGQNYVFDITDSCGDQITDQTTPKTPIQNQCPSHDLRQAVSVLHPVRHEFISKPQFSEDGGQLALSLGGTHGGPPHEWIQLAAGGYVPFKGLAYLALGDSYSSGEGDMERFKDTKAKWYRVGTDIKGSKTEPGEKCHISMRSYPYRLAVGMNMRINSDWQTIACSGATAWDVRGPDSSYIGQRDRLKGFEVSTLKGQALNEFIPGRAKQVEFVKRYKPEVITLTMGGNDVGFGDKINSCTRSPNLCEPARADYRPALKKEILNQFDNLTSLYEELAKASDYRAKILVLGYPQFISGDDNVSCKNTFLLSAKERKMIHESIIYLNSTIKAAAASAGVAYIDTEDALSGKKICQGDDIYVTPVTNIFGFNGNELQESFHPNAKGHQAIADTVTDELGTSDLRTLVTCSDGRNECRNSTITADSVEDTDYFSVEAADTQVRWAMMAPLKQEMPGILRIALGQFTFQPTSAVTAVMHSEPVNLGTFTTNADGSLFADISIPTDVEVGYHRIVVSGKAPSGGDVEYYQYIFVQGDNSDDLNDNGIKDSGETCSFLLPDTEDSDNSGLRSECEQTKRELAQSGQEFDVSKTSLWSPSSSDIPVFSKPASYAKLRAANNPGEAIGSMGATHAPGEPKGSERQAATSSYERGSYDQRMGPELSKWPIYTVASLMAVIFVSAGIIVYKHIKRR